jgi:DeoR/GlpR family transcriptional regulator of sugar metabolism
VSDMTVRRDLELLHERGLLEKVHGGAASIEGSSKFEPGFTIKSGMMESEKNSIAEAAAELVEPGTAIAISAGTTTFALARLLVDIPGLTVVTNSVPVADALYRDRRSDQTVILSGGVRTPSDALVGPFAVEVIRSLHVDTVFMGVHGMDPRSGFTTPNILEAETNRALIDAGRRLVLMADHTKWGIIGISSIGRLDEADILITDSGLDPADVAQLAGSVQRLILVDVATGERRTLGGEDGPSTDHGHGGPESTGDGA